MILGDKKKMYLTGGKSIYVSDLIVSGNKPRTVQGNVGKNSTIAVNSPKVTIKNCDASAVEGMYNLIEQPYSASDNIFPVSEVNISGLKIGTKPTHNAINFYKLSEGAKIVVKDSEFSLNDNSNAIRFDNLTLAENVEITFENCTWEYETFYGEKGKFTAGNLPWLALILFENAASSSLGKPIMGSWKINIINCKYGETEISPENIENGLVKWISNENTLESHIAIFANSDDGMKESKYIIPFSEEYYEFYPEINVKFGSKSQTWRP